MAIIGLSQANRLNPKRKRRVANKVTLFLCVPLFAHIFSTTNKSYIKKRRRKSMKSNIKSYEEQVLELGNGKML